MRGIILFIISLCAISASFISYFIPFVFYSWVDLLKPQARIWGIFGDVPYAEISFFVGIFMFFISGRKKILKINLPLVFLVLFIMHVSISHLLSDIPIFISGWRYDGAIKNLIFVFFCSFLLINRVQAEALISVFALVVSFFIVQKFWITIHGGGGYNNGGIADAKTTLEETSTFSISCYIASSYLWYLSRYSLIFPDNVKKYLRYLFPVFLGMSLVASVGVEARSGLVVLVALLVYLFFKTKRKIIIAFFALSIALLALFFAPDSWKNRMMTIDHYENEASAMGRIEAWKFSFILADRSPVWGQGYGAFEANGSREAHNIFFEVLGEHGYGGLFLYASMLLSTIYLNFKTYKIVYKRDDSQWIKMFCFSNSISFLSFFVGGMFLNLSRNFLFYMFFLVTMFLYSYVMKNIVYSKKKQF